jgi:predicted PurR-regulated permease PerM
VTGLVWLIVFTATRGVPDLVAQTQVKYDDLKQWLLDSPFQITEAQINEAFENFIQGLREDSSSLVDAAGTVTALVGHIGAGVLLVLFATLFILIDGRGIWAWIVRLFPRPSHAALFGAGAAGWLTLSNFVRVQVFVAFVDAVGIGLGAYILGLFYGGFPLVIPIAIIVFLGSFIPVVGAVLSGIIAVGVALLYLGPWPAFVMLLIVIGVQQLEGHVLQPFVVGTVVRVHPLAVVIAVATGGYLAGIAGALFAVPVVAVANVMISYIARGDWRVDPQLRLGTAVPPSRGPRSRVK